MKATYFSSPELGYHSDLGAGPVEWRGNLDLERTEAGWLPHRLPRWTRDQYPPDSLQDVVLEPSGVRLALRTAADTLELSLLATQGVWRGDVPPARVEGFDLVVDGDVVAAGVTEKPGTIVVFDETGVLSRTEAAPGTVRFSGLQRRPGEHEIEIWLPHHTRVEVIGLRADAPLVPPTPAPGPVWLHHGSSISHCREALRPTGTWPAVAARLAGLDLLNLGFSGQAQLDGFTARAIRDTPADLISLKLGINVVNGDSMRLRAFVPAVHAFLDTIREGHPRTPILLISPIHSPSVEDRPGPSLVDPAAAKLWFITHGTPSEVDEGRLSLRLIRDTLAAVAERRGVSDPNLHFLAGPALFGPDDIDHLPDNLHPDPVGYQLMGERFARLALAPGAAFRAPTEVVDTASPSGVDGAMDGC
ncbi:lipase [Streptomyces sp. SID13666]|nr:lipase [Streptomyces sp. SID13666]NEA76060.1 lipase [Streptomyces sp. SID13588]